MTRRELLRNAALVGVFGLFSLDSIYSQSGTGTRVAQPKPLVGFQKVNLGGLEMFILSDGFIREKNVSGYSPRADLKQVKVALKKGFRSQEYIDMAINVPLIRVNDRLILCDSGMGIFADANNGILLQSLASAGFNPDQVTDIFISHAHIDHIGGLIDKDNILVFPNAVYHIGEKEFKFWISATINDFKHSDLFKHPETAQFLIDAAKKILTIIKSKVTFFDYEKSLYEHFTFQLAGGHTPGMTLVSMRSGQKELVFMADLAHSDLLLFPHPEWGFFADTNVNLAIASRKTIFKQLSRSGTIALGCHLPWPGLGHVSTDVKAYRWNPLAYFAPGEIIL